jgi:hypothetical protein
MKSIKTLKKQAIKAAELSFKKGVLDESAARKFVKGFKTLPLNEAVVSLNFYLQAIKREKAKTTLTVESVVKIPKSELKSIEGVFKKQYQVLETREDLDTSLLGGVKVRIGDIIFDNSLKSKLAQIGDAITNG